MSSHFQQYLSYFKGQKTYQLFPDSDKNLRPLVLENAKPSELWKLNQKGYGVFMTVNETDGKGRKATNVKRVRAVFADLDGSDPELAMDDMPHLLVESSPGKYHAYWFVDDKFPLEGFTQVQKAIAHKYGSDKSVNDLPRVLRVPGFMHQKGEPYPTRIVWKNPIQSKISFERAVELFPPEPVKRFSAPKFNKPKINNGEINVGSTIPELLEKYGWSWVHGNKWRRPGKSHGISGILSDDNGIFWPYTDGTCLTPNQVHDAFEIVAQYEFGGSKSECMRRVRENKK